MSNNTVLSNWNQAFGLPDYASINIDDFAPALDIALSEAREKLDAITANAEAATFANTLLPLEHIMGMGSDFEKVCGLFYSISSTCSTPKLEELEVHFGAKLSDFYSEMMSSEALFARIQKVWEDRESLDPLQQRLVTLKHQEFVRGGANLSTDKKKRLAQIMSRLSELGTKFTQTVLDDEREWFMPLDEATVSKLPEFVQNACKAAAEQNDDTQATHIVTLARSIITPFLQFCPDRELRRKAYEAWVSRGEVSILSSASNIAKSSGTDNKAGDNNVKRATEILKLREERANLLGFDTFAQYKLDAEMAKTPDAVRDLLMQVWEPALAAAKQDAAILEQRLQADMGEGATLQAWDWHYYSEARRKEELDLDEAQIKPYFQLDKMIEAAFDCAHRLFGLSFEPVQVSAWHPDCRAWDITRDGQHMAVFIADYFARSGKRSGAWCTSLLGQHGLLGEAGSQRPQVINVCNFAKGSKDAPALLSYDDARTLFHEFGHALHHILSNVQYQSLAGLNVERDFVELPSQLYEHWLSVPEVLDNFATHVQTGEAMPEALRDRLLAAQTYDAGFATVEFVATAIVDLELHDMPAPADALEAQGDILEQIGMPAQIRMRHATPHLMHAFSGDGYSSGYYSYLWAEVMDADAFDAFATPFDSATAKRLEAEIYSRGTTRTASEHYIAFRGNMPNVDPLLKGRGLLAG